MPKHERRQERTHANGTTAVSLPRLWGLYGHGGACARTGRQNGLGGKAASRTGVATRHCLCDRHQSAHDHPLAAKKVLRSIEATILPTATCPEIEIDEQWAYVGNKGDVVWHWVAVERSTKWVVGWAVGDRSAATCRTLWESLPADYRKCSIFYTDEYFVYRQVLPASRHRPHPKGHEVTSQVDCAHNTFRQWCANLVRKTLSFSRDVYLHTVRLRLVIDSYNAERAGIWWYQ
jgi:insertion element IS1 protein InsB